MGISNLIASHIHDPCGSVCPYLPTRPVVRAIMDLIRSVDLGISVLGFISPPGYFSGIGVDVTQKTPLFTMFFLNAAYQTVLATSRF